MKDLVAYLYNSFNKRLIFSFVLILICFVNNLSAQAPLSEYKVKAVFLYNFTRFIDWPGKAFTAGNTPFKIGILGKDPFGSYLDETMRGENVSGHPIVIERYENLKQVGDCHILFINFKGSERIKDVIASTKDKNILTISEHENFVKWGGMIRIFSENNKIRMQINDNAARNSDIKISAKLLNIAEVYYP